MADGVLAGKFNAIIAIEETNGTFKTPVAGDNNFPLGVLSLIHI